MDRLAELAADLAVSQDRMMRKQQQANTMAAVEPEKEDANIAELRSESEATFKQDADIAGLRRRREAAAIKHHADIAEIREIQKSTDHKLKALIDIVDRLFRGRQS